MNPNAPIFYNPDGSICPGGDKCSGDCRKKLRCTRCDELFRPHATPERMGPVERQCENCIEDPAIQQETRNEERGCGG